MDIRINLRIALVTGLTLWSSMTYGQTVKNLENVSTNYLVTLLNELSILTEIKTDSISIRLFKINNLPGSAEQPSSEVSCNIYIAVSEFDEDPMQTVHIYGPVYNPKVLAWTGEPSEQILSIEFGPLSSRKEAKLKISIAKVTVLN